jgi:competence protein ComEC
VHPDVAADVLKMPHHGSGQQSPAFFDAVGAKIATISCGQDNDYGHPAAAALQLLREHHVAWWRTDTDGDVAVVVRDGRLAVVTR